MAFITPLFQLPFPPSLPITYAIIGYDLLAQDLELSHVNLSRVPRRIFPSDLSFVHAQAEKIRLACETIVMAGG